jgi:hypothetical protein
MAVTIYKSTDASVPTLSGTAGDLVTVLDACLVNGYGAKSAAGWTKSFSGTNTATYRQGTGSNQFYLHVNDNGPGAGTGKEARIFGSETASAVLTGTNLFPTTAQMANGVFVRKSNTLDATASGWIVAADQRTFYMFVLTGDTTNTYLCWMFGEFYSYKSSDPGRCLIWARDTENSATTTSGTERSDCLSVTGNTIGGHYLARDATGNPGACAAGKVGDVGATVGGTTLMGMLGNLVFTNAADVRLYLAPIRVTHTQGGNIIRGRLRGLWHFCHAIANANHGDTFTGTGDLAGRTFEVIKGGGNGGLFIIESSNTWDSN